MNFCVISPAAGLQQFSTRSRTHLVLSHVDNALYREFYRQRRSEDDLIILDNGAYEGQMDKEKLLESVLHYRPQVIVLPDILLGDAKESFELSKEFHQTWRSQIDCQWMYVPQAPPNHFADWLYYLNRGIDEIKPEWIGIPHALATHIAKHPYAVRADMCAEILSVHPDLHVHALGMVAGSLEDLDNLRQANCTSIDSSAPVWRGWNDFKIDDYDAWNKSGTDCDFNARPLYANDLRIKLINENLAKCGLK